VKEDKSKDLQTDKNKKSVEQLDRLLIFADAETDD
jgi:hypothetical protein